MQAVSQPVKLIKDNATIEAELSSERGEICIYFHYSHSSYNLQQPICS